MEVSQRSKQGNQQLFQSLIHRRNGTTELIQNANMQRVVQTESDDGSQEPIEVALIVNTRPMLETASFKSRLRIARYFNLQADSHRIANRYRHRLISFARTYDSAYQRYAQVLGLAQKSATDQQKLLELAIGFGVGVAGGLLAESVLALKTVKNVLGSVGSRIPKLARKLGKEAVSEGTEVLIGKSINVEGLAQVDGTDLEIPRCLDSREIKTLVWQSLADLYGTLTSSTIQNGIFWQSMLAAEFEYAVGEIKSLRGGQNDMPSNELANYVIDLLEADKKAEEIDLAIDIAMQKLTNLERSLSQLPEYSIDELEKEIWLLWMSGLKFDSNALDEDDIENRLEELDLVNFGFYTFDQEEIAAIRMAQQKAPEIKARWQRTIFIGP